MSSERTERRDPVSPLLRLGTVLSSARLEKLSGRIRVEDDRTAYLVSIYQGGILQLVERRSDAWRTVSGGCDAGEAVARLFELRRPHVQWDTIAVRADWKLRPGDPASSILSGLRARQDLFDPVRLVERIPLSALEVDPITLHRLAKLPLAAEERAFLARLDRPTPVQMALWKRGLNPRHAGAMLVALNLLGAWGDGWKPGELPRATTARSPRAKARATLESDEYQVLGVATDASEREIDRAFRRLSFELHPDRLHNRSPAERAAAEQQFAGVSEAYNHIKRSRRSRPVVSQTANRPEEPASWLYNYQQIRIAGAAGDFNRVRIFALRALAGRPPERVRAELLNLLTRAA